MDLSPPRGRSRTVRVLAVALPALALAPAAVAGGDFVDLAVTPAGVFVVGPFGIRDLSPTTGRAIWAPRPRSARYPQSVVVSDGALWVASVANGFVDGTLTRTDLRSHRARVVLRVSEGSVLYVAAGGGGVYALLGDHRGNSVVRFTPVGRRSGSWRVPGGGRLAADSSGCWVSARDRLVHIDRSGRLSSIDGIGLGDLSAAEGSVWIAQERSIVRVDEHSGAATRLTVAPLHLGGFQHDLTVGDGALWTLDALRRSIQRRAIATGRVERSARLPDIPDAVVARPNGIWVGIGATHQVLRLNPRTLRTELAVTVS